MTQSNSKQTSKPIENAEKIIERFGGIRPMASKTNVPVTTVQGWKKRNVIPAGRREDIIEAAAANNIDLTGLLDVSANENARQPQESVPQTQKTTSVPRAQAGTIQNETPEAAASATVNPAMPANEDVLKQRLNEIEERAVTKSTLITFFLLAVAIIALAVVLWPSSVEDSEAERIRALEQQIQTLEDKLSETESGRGFLQGMIPEDLDARLAALQSQAQQVQDSVGAAMEKAQAISNDVMAEDGSNLEERLARLEAHMADLSGSPALAGFLEHFQSLQQTETGNSQIDQAVSELSAMFANMQNAGSEQINASLDAARTQSAAVGETFAGVPAEELKAAAMLLAMSQVRSSLNRDNQPFADDLVLLQNLVGSDNPELNEALAKLAPKAEEGVLTPAGLSNELKSLTGDIVIASLKGEDVSMQEKAAARFNNFLQIEQDGELVTGTPTQATLTKTENLLNSGDLAGAITAMKSLNGPAALKAQPWINQAEATLMAQQLSQFFQSSINLQAFGQKSIGGVTTGGGYGQGTLIRDEETGINILKPAKSFALPQ